MNSLFFKEFSYVIEKIKTNNSISGLIINSEGRHFSSGANIDQLLSLFENSEDTIPKSIIENSLAFRELSNFSFPVIACIKGVCFGSALELTLCAHFRIASSNALLSFPEVGFDIMPGLAGIYNSQKCIGNAKTLEFVLSGETIPAVDAQKSGLIDMFANKNELENRAIEIINRISKNYKKELKLNYLRLLNQQNG